MLFGAEAEVQPQGGRICSRKLGFAPFFGVYMGKMLANGTFWEVWRYVYLRFALLRHFTPAQEKLQPPQPEVDGVFYGFC
jgi:hypothetical protein